MNEAVNFLKACGTFYVATCEDGQPRVRPFGALDVYEDKLYIVTSREKRVFKQLQKDSKLEICAMNPDRRWIRIAADAVLDDRLEAREHMLETNEGLKSLYSADDGKMVVLYLQNAVAEITSFGPQVAGMFPHETIRF